MDLFSLSHYVQPWILPPGINLAFVIIGFLICFFSRKFGIFLIGVGFITLWLLSAPIVAYQLIGLLQNAYPMLQPNSFAKPLANAAILVLGGGDSVDADYGNKHTVSDSTLRRLKYAYYIYQKTHLPIIVSGGRTIASLDSEADLMSSALKENYRITPQFKEDKSMNTADESKFIAPLLKKNGFHQIYLVTNAWHMPRSVYIFQCRGIKVTPAPMGYYVYGPGYALISFLPNIDALQASATAIHEWVGLFWYHIYYGSQCKVD